MTKSNLINYSLLPKEQLYKGNHGRPSYRSDDFLAPRTIKGVGLSEFLGEVVLSRQLTQGCLPLR